MLKSLIVNMKRATNGVGKLTGLFETIFCVAYRQLLVEHGEQELANAPLRYLVPISLRQKLGIRTNQMGVYISALLVDDDGNDRKDGIWSSCERRTRSLHSRIAHNEELMFLLSFARSSPPPTTTVSIDELEAGQELKSLSYFMDLTNFGTFDDCDDDNRAALSVRAISCALPLLNRQMSGYLVVSLATVNDTMSITMSFNERVFRREFIVRLKHAVQALILNYIEKEFIY